MNGTPLTPNAHSTGTQPKRAHRALRRLAGLAVVVVGLHGCRLFGPSEYRVIGISDFDYQGWPLPEVPESATAGVPFEVTITTGGNSCYRGGDTGLVVKGRSATVTPYDYIDAIAMRAPCPDNLVFFEHGVPVVFEEPGTAEILFRYSTDGRRPEEHKGDGRKVYTMEVAEAPAK